MTQHAFGSISRGAAAALGVILCVAFIAGIAAFRGWSPRPRLDPTDARVFLSDIERSVAAIYPVPEIAGSEVAEKLAHNDVVLFDVRAAQEFATSHLPGAIYLDPDMTAERFVAEYGDRLRGRVVVFYCAVGARSGRMLERVGNAIASYRPAAAYNLRGGIFRWFVERRAIENASGPASAIHPYDAAWEGLLQRTLARR